MAAPISHIFLALQLLASPLGQNFDKEQFIVGTSFPDIRYLGVVSRKITHAKNVSLEEVLQANSSFEAGMLFHSYVDEKREQYMQQQKVYDFLPNIKYKHQCLKFAEDLVLLENLDSKPYIPMFNNIYNEELEFGISKEDVAKWHKILQVYLAEGPTKNAMSKILDTAYPDFSIKKLVAKFAYRVFISKIINSALQNNDLVEIIENFYFNPQELLDT